MKDNHVACKANANMRGVLTKDFTEQKMDDSIFMCSSVAVKRLSGIEDIVPIYIPADSDISPKDFKAGDTVKLSGSIRTFSKRRNGRLLILVSLDSIEIEEGDHYNCLNVCGFLVTEPIKRVTPKGKIIADLKIAVNYPDGSAYIPAIAWGSLAEICAKESVGTFLQCKGEFHSRGYIKNYEDGTSEQKVAYECSFRSLVVK